MNTHQKWMAVVNIPPPFTGASVVSERFLEDVRSEGIELETVNVVSAKRGVFRFLKDVRQYARAAIGLSSQTFDVCYAQGTDGPRVWATIVLAVICRVRGIEFYFHHHSSAFVRVSSLSANLLFRRVLQVRHIALTNAMAEEISLRRQDCSTIVSGNAAAVRSTFYEPSSSRTQAARTKPLLLFVGRGGIGKGEDFCIELADAFALSEACELVIAGPGHDSSSAGSHDDSLISYAGSLEIDELSLLFQQADLLLLPSKYPTEAAPLVVYEAAACGLRVLASDVGYMTEIAEESDLVDVLSGFEKNEWVEAARSALDGGLVESASRTSFKPTIAKIYETVRQFETKELTG